MRRREFLTTTSLGGTATLLGMRPTPADAEPPPETTTIRLIYDPDNSGLCYAPVFLASELLRGEGFTDVRYVKQMEKTLMEPPTLVAGLADMSAMYLVDLIAVIDQGMPVVMLAPLHGGCQELVVTDRVRTIRDLKGKKIAVMALGSGDHLVFSNMLAYIGMNPRKDIQWVTDLPVPEWIQSLAEGKIDALWAFPPPGSGDADEEDRPRHSEGGDGSPLVSVRLLHAGREAGVRPKVPRGDEAGAPRDPEGQSAVHVGAREDRAFPYGQGVQPGRELLGNAPDPQGRQLYRVA